MLTPLGMGLRGMTLRYPYEIRNEADYFADIPDIKLPAEMLKLADHIVDTKAGTFEPTAFVDHYETALVELLKSKQAGAVIAKPAPRAAGQAGGNVIDLLRRSLEIESGEKAKKAPPLQPAMPKGKAKSRRRA